MEKINNFNTFRPNKRILLVTFFTLSFLTLGLITYISNPCAGGRIRTANKALAYSTPDGQQQQYYRKKIHSKFVDLNHLEATPDAKKHQEKVLILTPLKNAAQYLPRYVELIESLSYPKHLISIAFLVSDTTDETVTLLRSQAEQFLNRKYNRYDSITIFEKDFHFELPEDKRHSFELQPLRRSFMARSRNYLLSAALRDDHSWVLWLDVDVVEYPDTIIEDLQSVDVDIVVPNCLRETEDGSFWGYDKNNWQETEESRQIQETLDPVSLIIIRI
jgi:hypothetical protein